MENHRYKPSTRLFLLIAALALFIVPVVAYAAGGFTDVGDDNVFKNDIQWMKDTGLTKGCNPPANTKFCPEDNVTREQMSAFMHRLAVNKVVDAGTVEGMTAAELKGQKGDTGPPGADGILPDGTPPVGTTARGTYALGNMSWWAWDSIGWGFEMPSPPTPHFLTKGSVSTSECPGTPVDPQAAEGHLCVYETEASGVADQSVRAGSTGDPGTADTFGAIVYGRNPGSGTFLSYGTWAITVGSP